MTAFGFRWYGPEDAVTLEHIRQIPPVTELVTSLYHIPAGALWPEEDIAARAARAAAAGLHFSVAEGLPVHESIKLGGPERERYIGQFVENLERLARHGVHTVCYNFMPLFGWIRTELEQPLPDGSATLAFHQAALERMNPERDVWTLPGWNFSTRQGEIRTLLGQYRALGEAGLWNNLRYFLQAVVPEAERLGIRLAIGIFNDERDPRENLKDIPTFKEMGYDVTMSVWKFLMLPAGTPEDVVTKVTETLTAITETDEYKEFCDANQLLPLTLTTEEMVERINEEAAVNQELLVG